MFTIFLMAALAYVQIGHGVVMLCRQQAMRYEVKKSLLQNISLAKLSRIVARQPNDISWENHDDDVKEFFYKGSKYDLVAEKVEYGETVYYALNDTQEEQVLLELKAYQKQSTSKGQMIKQISAQVLYLPALQIVSASFFPAIHQNNYTSHLPVPVTPGTLPDIFCPPRQAVLFA